MEILAALSPILVVLGLMALFHWNGQKAGLAGWMTGLVISYFLYGLNLNGILVSQLKGLYLSCFVLAIIWPALGLYHLVNQAGGVQAIAYWISSLVRDQGLLQVGLAWAFSGMIEGLAGFGLPVAVVSPILVGIGVPPITAVAATAVGHSWSVTFGDMGVIFQTLVTLTGFDPKELILPAGLLLGFSCLVCGWATMFILKLVHLWKHVSLIGLGMAAVQLALAYTGLVPLSSLLAGLAGLVIIFFISPRKPGKRTATTPLKAAGLSYGALAVLLFLVTLVSPIHSLLETSRLEFTLPGVITGQEYQTVALKQTVQILLHPGAFLALVFICSTYAYRRNNLIPGSGLKTVLQKTWLSALPTSTGILLLVGLATLMDYSGMMRDLAFSISKLTGWIYPLFSSLIGILGAFTTGSNNNSNVIFAQLQLNTAQLLNLNQAVILAAQTTGGALGSMLAPAKIIVGCSTVGVQDGQGQVLRLTLGIGLGIGLAVGIICLLFA